MALASAIAFMLFSAALGHGVELGGGNDTSYEVELPPWSFGGGIILVIFWAFLCSIPCVCCFWAFFQGDVCDICRPCTFKLVPRPFFSEEQIMHLVPTSMPSAFPLDFREAFSDSREAFPDPMAMLSGEVNAEVVFALALPVATFAATGLAASAGGAFLGAGGAAIAAERSSYVLMTSAGLRTFFRDLELSRKWRLVAEKPIQTLPETLMSDMKKCPSSPFLLTKLEIIDAISDGAAITAVLVLEMTDPQFTGRLLFAWSQGGWASQQVALGLKAMNLSGCMAASFVGAIIGQWGAANIQSGPAIDFPQGTSPILRADMAGLGALGNEDQGSAEAQDDKNIVLHASRIMGEGLQQLLWQSCGLMAMGTGLLQNPVMLLSLVLTVGTTAKKGLYLTLLVRSEHPTVKLFGGCFGIPILVVTFYVAVRLVMTELCPQHSWGFNISPFEGCVEFPPELQRQGE